jgi:hypothetical protein
MNIDHKSGLVQIVHQGGQPERLGVESGWRFHMIDGEEYSWELLKNRCGGLRNYTVAFVADNKKTLEFHPAGQSAPPTPSKRSVRQNTTVLGIECWPRSGVIFFVDPNGQGERLGVKTGWKVLRVNGAKYSDDTLKVLNALKNGSETYTITFQTQSRPPMAWQPSCVPCYLVVVLIVGIWAVSFCLFMYSSSSYMEFVTYTDERPTVVVPPPLEVEEVDAAASRTGTFITWDERWFILVPRMQRYLILLVVAWILHLFVIEPCGLMVHLFFNEPRIQDSTLFISRVWDWIASSSLGKRFGSLFGQCAHRCSSPRVRIRDALVARRAESEARARRDAATTKRGGANAKSGNNKEQPGTPTSASPQHSASQRSNQPPTAG